MQVSQQNTKGFTFLELLIALAVFSAGLLGVLQLQMLVQRQMYDALYISRAVQQAYNLSALLIMFNASKNSALSMQLQTDWNTRNAEILPEGSGEIKGENIVVVWQSPLEVNKSVVEMQYGVMR
ncbi:MAG: prepilin-type N-terminal cleavage/methylation domain-containing protein [Gammaproteobacteria bacterium]|jgi:prepilin-type N-terminal cleavage/methylation domain-containing protein